MAQLLFTPLYRHNPGFGFTNKDEYIRTMYYLFHIYKLTTLQLAVLFRVPTDNIYYKLRKLGFSISHEEGIQRKKDQNRQNYEKSLRNAKVSRAKDQIKNSSSGSKNENYARTLFANLLYDYLSSDIYDIVVGVNTIGILGAKEADIPIIVLHREKIIIFKFLIEYNGEIYHDAEKDYLKKKIANERRWIYIPLVEKQNNRFSNSQSLIELAVKNICNRIKKIVTDRCNEA